MKHPALKTETWKAILNLTKQHKPFIIQNQYNETKTCTPNTYFYEHELRGWFKFCYDLGDIMTVSEI